MSRAQPVLEPSSDRPVDTKVVFLCVFAVFNPLVIQVWYFLSPPAIPGNLSGPQVFQGVAFLIGVAVALGSHRGPTSSSARTGRFLALVIISAAIFLGKSVLVSGDLAEVVALRADFIFYFKMTFWAFSWFLVSILIRSEREAECLLTALVVGALITAVIAIVCFATGAGTIAVYAREGVRASVGASGVSVKQTVAYLAPAALLAIYLGRRRNVLVGVMVAVTLFISTLLSYDRAIQAGLVVGGVWLLAWWFLRPGPRSFTPVNMWFIIGGLVTLVLFAGLSFEALHTRWTADLAEGRPGSGRLEFYRAAWSGFLEGSPAEIVAGVGYSGIVQTMTERCGLAIHTHSDLFDLLLGGGLIGLGLYGVLICTLGRFLLEIPPWSAERAVMGGVGAIWIVMSLLTGLLEATHAMFFFGSVFICSHVISACRAGRDLKPPAGDVD